MTFVVHMPGYPLNRAVELFYAPARAMPYASEHVLPSGSIDLKINFGDPVRARGADRVEWDTTSRNGWVMGIWNQFHAVRWPANVDFIGMTLRPGATLSLFGVEACELVNKIVDVDAVLGPFARQLRERLGDTTDLQIRFRLLEEMLTARLRPLPRPDRIAPALRMLELSNGTASVHELASAAGVSHKHLIHLFKRVAGAPPKTVARLHRLEKLLATIESEASPSWTSTAMRFEYFDQAHFSRDFKNLTGRTAGQYLEQRLLAKAIDPLHGAHRRLLPAG